MLFMLLCSMTAFAANVNTSYNGILKINVHGGIATIANQEVAVVDNSNGTITMTIKNFQFAGLVGVVTIVANIASDGTLSDPKVCFSNLPILVKRFYTDSSVSASTAEVHLKMYCLTKNITVDYSGK